MDSGLETPVGMHSSIADVSYGLRGNLLYRNSGSAECGSIIKSSHLEEAMRI